MRYKFYCLVVVLIVRSSLSLASDRTLEFETTQVTAPDVALSPDGQTLVFTMLGHLFSLPSAGGTANQLTFGHHYDSEPVFSPDGSQIAFTSDRDDTEGNIFVLTLKDSHVVQLTHEESAGRATWSPDGQWIVYLRYERGLRSRSATVSRVLAQGGRAETVNVPPRRIGSTFYLSDGRLAWSVIERDAQSADYLTRLESLSSEGSVSTLRAIPGIVDRVIASSGDDLLYCHRKIGADLWMPIAEDLIVLPATGGAEKQVVPVSSLGRFALSADGKSLYLGDGGHLWKVPLPTGGSQAVTFRAHVKLDVQKIVTPTNSPVEEHVEARVISSPRLSPDGHLLVFGAAGYLWRQRLDGGKAERISQDAARESEPAFSPDGHQLAFVHTEHGEDSVRLLDLMTGQSRVLASGPSISELSWSFDGQRLIAVVGSGFEQDVTAFNVTDGKSQQLADAGFWSPRPQLSADGNSLYYTANTTGIGNLYRLILSKDAKPEAITHLSRHLSDAQVSRDGKMVVFRRNRSIFAASLTSLPVRDVDIHELTPDGGDSFALTPDGVSVIYAIGRHVWRQPVTGGDRQEISVSLDLAHPLPPPLLVRAVRVLDPVSGSFGPPTSLLLENGRILRVGSEAGQKLPQGITIVDASGRFAIPGLFDMHVHSQGANEEAFLAYGVTSLRDTGGGLSWLISQQDRSESSSLPLPRYFYAGEIFEGERPYWGDGFLQIDNEKDAREYVRRFKQSGASFIKVYPSLSWPLKSVVVDEAHRLGLPVVGHGMGTEEIVKSVNLGFFSLEHTSFPGPVFDDVLLMLAAAGTRWDPTLAVQGGDSLLLRSNPELLNEPKFKTFTPPSYIDFARSGGYYRSVASDALLGGFSAQLASIARAHQLGVKLLVGTDAPNPECFFGPSLHWELARLVEAGLSPREVLRLATEEAAAAVGAENLGTIAPGKLADVLLLQDNPIENIHNTETVWRVVKGGWIFDPEKLPRTSIHSSSSEKANPN